MSIVQYATYGETIQSVKTINTSSKRKEEDINMVLGISSKIIIVLGKKKFRLEDCVSI